jgi:hypothetical protein
MEPFQTKTLVLQNFENQGVVYLIKGLVKIKIKNNHFSLGLVVLM